MTNYRAVSLTLSTPTLQQNWSNSWSLEGIALLCTGNKCYLVPTEEFFDLPSCYFICKSFNIQGTIWHKVVNYSRNTEHAKIFVDLVLKNFKLGPECLGQNINFHWAHHHISFQRITQENGTKYPYHFYFACGDFNFFCALEVRNWLGKKNKLIQRRQWSSLFGTVGYLASSFPYYGKYFVLWQVSSQSLLTQSAFLLENKNPCGFKNLCPKIIPIGFLKN